MKKFKSTEKSYEEKLRHINDLELKMIKLQNKIAKCIAELEKN